MISNAANAADVIDDATYELNVLNNLLAARYRLRHLETVAAMNTVFRDRPYHNIRVRDARALVYQYENQLKDIQNV